MSTIDQGTVVAAPLGQATRLPAISPADLGLIGWTADPIYLAAANTGGPNLGNVYCWRFVADTSAVANFVTLNVTTGGVGLTVAANFVGLYDTGQAAPGVATLLATSADQSTPLASTGAVKVAMVAGAALVAGQPYFVAAILNASSSGPMLTGISAIATFFNVGLSGLALRSGRTTSGGITTLPATIAAGAFVSANQLAAASVSNS